MFRLCAAVSKRLSRYHPIKTINEYHPVKAIKTINDPVIDQNHDRVNDGIMKVHLENVSEEFGQSVFDGAVRSWEKTSDILEEEACEVAFYFKL
ncbi:hypothetical protein A2U01_0011544 [Trifolium medium]|uniref:Uncharacterized protein n=1 Tax=Trifolium medium TaxID=97028 RepID=A0A392MWH6_9FABA|nr:hypothetical protein [Trifolium medium]